MVVVVIVLFTVVVAIACSCSVSTTVGCVSAAVAAAALARVNIAVAHVGDDDDGESARSFPAGTLVLVLNAIVVGAIVACSLRASVLVVSLAFVVTSARSLHFSSFILFALSALLVLVLVSARDS